MQTHRPTLAQDPKASPKTAFSSVRNGTLQRKVRNSENERQKESMVPPSVHEVLRSPGQPLDSNTRAFMETRFSGDFSQVPSQRKSSEQVLSTAGDTHEQQANLAAERTLKGAPPAFHHMPFNLANVRIHADEKAMQSAHELDARAYTVGSCIVFGRGQYAPREQSGRWLLAHELAHVAQQQRYPSDAGPLVQRVGIFQSIARFFGGGTFGDEELQAYLAYLSNNRKIEDKFDSDNKAREVVKRWKAGAVGFTVLIVPIRILLINEMASGYLSDADQDGILDLLGESLPAERSHILPAINIDMLKTRFDGDRRKKLGTLLENQEGEEIGLSGEWSVPETKKINARFGDGGVLQRVLAAGFKIFRFDTAFDKWRYDDGRIEENEVTGLLGNTDRNLKRIRLRKTLTNEQAASTLFHESDHALAPPPPTQAEYLEGEVHARVEAERFGYRHGMAEHEPGYRTPDGQPDVAAIRRDMQGSDHYNPVHRAHIFRRYVGEIETTGW